jgi:hypothetical protein
MGSDPGARRTIELTRLAQLGIELLSDDDAPAARAECLRIARRIQLSGRRVIALVPAASNVAVPGLAVQIGLGLCDLSGATVALVDANVRWPGLSGLVAGESRDTEESVFATRWLHGQLALLTPPRAADEGAGVPQLQRLLREGLDLFAYVLCDLTGFDRLGEHLSAIALCEAVVVVAQTNVTRESQLLRWQAQIPPEKHMGVLLLG